MTILTLNRIGNSFTGATYYFAGFVDGDLRVSMDFEKSRIHFGGESEKDCVDKALKWIKKNEGAGTYCKAKIDLANLV